MNPVIFIKKIKENKYEILISFAAAFVLFCTAALAVPLKGENTVNVYDNTVRLRVVANSDSQSDQMLKLAVRDDIIETAKEIFEGCVTVKQAEASITLNRERLLETAKASVMAHGSDMPVSISFGREKCPVRRYSEFTFPAGEYLTLRINLGKAEGENWWCVMYPPLCVSAATREVTADKETFLQFGFTEKQIEELTLPDKKEIRFAIADFFKKLI